MSADQVRPLAVQCVEGLSARLGGADRVPLLLQYVGAKGSEEDVVVYDDDVGFLHRSERVTGMALGHRKVSQDRAQIWVEFGRFE